jgi:uroporphyrinogen-III synthase
VRLLVTRPEPDGERTAALLRERGHEVLQQPLLRIEPITDAQFGPGPWAGLVFTSANAVRALIAHHRFGELMALPAYTVGQRTQAAAVAAGFVSAMSADGDVDTLLALMASGPSMKSPVLREGGAASSSPALSGEGKGVGIGRGGTAVPHCQPPHPIAPLQKGRESRTAGPQPDEPAPTDLPLLYCAGEDRAGDLAGALQASGLRVETVCVYRAAIVADLAPDVRAAFAGDAIDAVLHYSARTAAAFVAAATKAGIRDLSIQARHLCLSAQVAVPLATAGATAIDIANAPNEQALFALVSPLGTPSSLLASNRER